ncbi:glutamate-cysteine ligase family protein [soil metagenome]
MTELNTPLHLFQAYGIELEYMIVNKKTLAVMPISDVVLHAIAGEYVSDVELGIIAWSNELVMHVIELKTNGPSSTLEGLSTHFQQNIQHINSLLQPHDAMLLPTGAHPFMNPHIETKLWPHASQEVYRAYNKIFNCQGHGWSNLQSTHINLPFANDDEFTRLHTAIRLLLPIMPALSASTPLLDSALTGFMDTRLEYYRSNQAKIPSITGHVIPEAVRSIEDYHQTILQTMYKEISPYDPDKILQEEWLNSRGAIARFDRSAIEIRVLDIQECPLADLAIAAFIVAVLQLLIKEQWHELALQLKFNEVELEKIFKVIIKDGQAAIINDAVYLSMFAYDKSSCSVLELWQHLLNQVILANLLDEQWFAPLQIILSQGNLAERMLKFLATDISAKNINNLYQCLALCLHNNEMFLPI